MNWPIEAARLLKVKPATLTEWRRTGKRSIPFVEDGNFIRYWRSDVEKGLRDRTICVEDREAACPLPARAVNGRAPPVDSLCSTGRNQIE